MSRLHRVVVFLLAMVGSWVCEGLLSGSAHAQVVSGGKVKPVVALEHSGYFGGSIYDIAVDGSYVYLVAGPTFDVVDIAEGANPAKLFSVQLPSRGIAVDFEDGLAYIGTVDHGLQIIDVWRAGGPVVVGTWSERKAISLLTVSGSRAYLRSGSHIDILDIANPATPLLLGTYTDAYTPFNSLHLAGNLLLFPVVQNNCSAGSPGCESYLRIVDVSNPAAPVLLASWTEPSAFIYDVVVHNGYAYVADYAKSLYILDFSNPATPSLVSAWASIPPRAVGLFVAEGTLYVAVSNSGTHSVQAYSLANPTSPELLLTHNAADGFAFFADLHAAAGKVIFLSGAVYNDVEIVDFPIGGAAAKAGIYAAIGFVNTAVLVDPYLYVLAGGDFYLLSADLPLSPTSTGIVRSPQGTDYVDLATDGVHAYILRGDSVVDVLNLSNPAAPQLITSVSAGNGEGIRSLYLSGNALYALYFTKLHVFDVTNPAQPAKLTDVTLQNAADAIVYGNYLYIVNAGPMQIFDISNPSTPQIVGSYELPNGGTLSLCGSLLFSGTSQAFSLIDLANPVAPVALTTVSLPQILFGQAVRQGDILHVGTSNGLMAVDVRDTSNPAVVGTFSSFGGFELIVQGERGYVLNGHAGLYEVKITAFMATDFVHLPLLSR